MRPLLALVLSGCTASKPVDNASKLVENAPLVLLGEIHGLAEPPAFKPLKGNADAGDATIQLLGQRDEHGLDGYYRVATTTPSMPARREDAR
jgi:hypothetical protein